MTISATPTSEKLFAAYVSNQTRDGVIPTITIGTGSTISRLVTTTSLTQSPGGIGWFLADTTTADLRQQVFHFRVVDGVVYVLYKSLPAIPVSGDQFKFVGIGSNRSSTDILAMLVGGDQPEMQAIPGVNITGLYIQKASAGLGEGTLTIDYDPTAYSYGAANIRIKMNSESYGEYVDLSATTGPAYIFNAAKDGWIKVTWLADSLPVTAQQDVWTLTLPHGTLTPDFEGPETNNTGGKVRFRWEAIQNQDPLNSMTNITVYPYCEPGTATTIALYNSLGLDAGSFDVTDASDWDVTASFWVRNTTKNDCRYIESRSGNTLTARKVDWVTLTGDGATAAAIGAVLTGSLSSATAIVVASKAGQAICKKLNGTFQVNDVCGTLGTVSAIKVGFRGFTAVAWEAGDTIEIMPDVDLALNEYTIKTVTTETQIPDGLTFVTPTIDNPLELGDLVSWGWLAVCRMEWILDRMKPRANVVTNTRYDWT